MRYAEHGAGLDELGLLHHFWPPFQQPRCAIIVTERAPPLGKYKDRQTEACDGVTFNRFALMMVLSDVNADAALDGCLEQFQISGTWFHEFPYVKHLMIITACNGIDRPGKSRRQILVDLRLQDTARPSNCSAFLTAARGRSNNRAACRASPPSACKAATMAIVGTPDSERMG